MIQTKEWRKFKKIVAGVYLTVVSWSIATDGFSAFTSVQQATITVSVSFTACDDGQQLMTLDAQAPAVALNPTPRQVSGAAQNLEVSGVASDDTFLYRIILYYKKTFDTEQSTLQMDFPCNVQSSEFRFQLPRSSVTSEGVLYRLEVMDYTGKVTSLPPSTTAYFSVDVTGFAQKLIGPEGGIIRVPDNNLGDGETYLDIPAGALDRPVLISIEQEDASTFAAPDQPRVFGAKLLTAQPVTAYRFEPSGLIFKKPATLKLLYPDRDQNGVLDGTDQDEELTKVFLQMGSGWKTQAGGVDTAKNEAGTRIMHFSVYAAFPALPLAPADYRPLQKIITPSRVDGHNDTAVFGNLGPDGRIEIYDSQGRRVRTLQSVFVWDGRDDEGRIVESGLYVYQFKIDGELISGVIAVAK